MSPYECRTGRAPNLQALHIKVFGCACQYAPHGGPEHKRASKTKWGWFVGIQWPMALILRSEDKKVISVSRKKIHCHELCYAKFDPTTQPRPVICFTDFALPEEEVDAAIQKAMQENTKAIAAQKSAMAVPDHVPSVKSLSDFQRNADLNETNLIPRPPMSMTADLPQAEHQGRPPREHACDQRQLAQQARQTQTAWQLCHKVVWGKIMI